MSTTDTTDRHCFDAFPDAVAPTTLPEALRLLEETRRLLAEECRQRAALEDVGASLAIELRCLKPALNRVRAVLDHHIARIGIDDLPDSRSNAERDLLRQFRGALS